MEGGKIRHRVQLQSAVYSRNDYGEPIPVWTTYGTRWAEVKDLSGRELYQAQQINAEVTIGVKLRYMTGIEPAHRLLFGSRILEIGAILNPDNRKIELNILCVESPDAG